MSREVVVALEFGRETISACSRIGPQLARELSWEAPDAASFAATEDGEAFVSEVLALMHLPNVDRLVIGLPAAAVEAQRAALVEKFTGLHDLRNTECRSQRLAVNVRRVEVVAAPSGALRPGTSDAVESAG